ncbi:MAG: ribosome-associated translation inhibitor RaiA [Ignavibacteria bacterium]|nr:ribosome-associated translation inhibitor RaiA [Ignavibacteria bacterium]
MDIHITSRKIKIGSLLKEHAHSEIEKFEHLFEHIQRCDVIFSKDGQAPNTNVAEIVLHANGHFLTSKEQTEDFRKSLDIAAEKVFHQLSTYKSKLTSRKKSKVARTRKALS